MIFGRYISRIFWSRFKDEGLIVIDNLETLSVGDRERIKAFVETQTPSEMQFILTSRNSEAYECNYKLAGFGETAGVNFVDTYSEENALDLNLSKDNKLDLVSLAQGNTLVLVLSLRRLSKKLTTIEGMKSEFSNVNAWRALRSSLTSIPSNAFEVIAEFMYKDTFEQIEDVFNTYKDLFYKVLKVFAVISNESVDISTICLLTKEDYPNVEAVMDILCNYLIVEKRDTQYSLNGFAEKYIVGRFLPDAETYNQMSAEITSRQRDVVRTLKQLSDDMNSRPDLAKIMKDWLIITDIDKINAAKMYNMYDDVKRDCNRAGKFMVTSALEEFLKKSAEAERFTAHPYIKYQRARILQMIDGSNVLPEKHVEEIKKSYNSSIYAIKTIQQYSGIQQTKSFASLLWLYGQYLADTGDYGSAIRYLEESKISFENQNIIDQEYYQCATKLGHTYLKFYSQDRMARLTYLRKARSIERMLSENWVNLGRARKYAGQLKSMLCQYGRY